MAHVVPRGWQAWHDACAQADRDTPGWRAADFFGPEGFESSRPTLTDRLKAVHAKLPADWPNWADALGPEHVLPIIEMVTRRAERENEHVAISDDPEDRKQLAIQAFTSLPNPPSNELRCDFVRNCWRAVLPNEAVVAAQEMIGHSPAEKLGMWKRPLVENPDLLSFEQSRKVAGVLQEHAGHSAEDDRPSVALRDIRAIFAAAACMDERPMLMSFICQIACQSLAARSVEVVLALTQPNDDDLESAQENFVQAQSAPTFIRHVRGEAAVFEDFITAYSEGLVSGKQIDAISPLFTGPRGVREIIRRWVCRIRGIDWRPIDAAHGLGYLRCLERQLSSSSDGFIRGGRELEALRKEMSIEASKAVVPADRVAHADCRRRALNDAAICGLAAERFRRRHSRWPESLGELTPEFLAHVPTGPYDLKPLRTRRTADGLIVYAVGALGIDEAIEQNMYTSGPVNPEHVFGLRLYDPAQRRLPAVTP